MYFQKDYVLRMIEMMGELVRRICSIAREADARAELDEISHRACGMPMRMLLATEPDALCAMLGEAQRFLAAELIMIEHSVRARAAGEEELLTVKAQALALYASLSEADYLLPAADRVSRMLSDSLPELPLASLLPAASLCERAGLFAAAEDALFAALALSPHAARPLLSAFYDRLDLETDAALLLGGLSRAEIAEGRDALNQRLNP